MNDIPPRVASVLQEVRTTIGELHEAQTCVREDFAARAAQFRQDAAAQQEADDEDDTDCPPGAPAEYREVMERIDTGEVHWTQLLTGRTDDPQVQKAHEWLLPKLEAQQLIGQLMKEGFSYDVASRVAFEECGLDEEGNHNGG